MKSGSFTTESYKGRSLTFSWTLESQDTANCTSTISWTLKGSGSAGGYVTCRNITLTVNGTVVYSRTGNNNYIDVYTTTVLVSGVAVIQHDVSTGDKMFSASCSAGIYYSRGNCSGSGSWALPNIARRSVLNIENGTLGVAQNLSVTQYDTTFTHTVAYECGTASGVICEKSTDTSLSFTPPVSLASQNTTGTNVSVAFTTTTYSGETVIGAVTTTVLYEIPASVVPTCSLSVSDAMGYLSKFSAYVQSKSKANVKVNASGVYGSTITKYSTTIDGKTFNESTFETDVLNGSGKMTVKTTVTDSRGRMATATVEINVLAYSLPSIGAISVSRCDASGASNVAGAYIAVRFNATISALNNKNDAIYTVKRKRFTDVEYEDLAVNEYKGVHAVTDGVFIFAADTASSYNVSLVASDAFASASRSAVVSSAEVFWSKLRRGMGIAIGKVAEYTKTIEIAKGWKLKVGGDTEIDGALTVSGAMDAQNFLINGKSLLDALHPVGSLYWSKDPTSPEVLFGGKWKQIKDRFILAAGDTYAAGSYDGEAEVTLTVDQIPSHTHRQTVTGGRSGSGSTYVSWNATNVTGNTDTDARNTLATGGGKAHNNMPPYVAYYCWERIPDATDDKETTAILGTAILGKMILGQE